MQEAATRPSVELAPNGVGPLLVQPAAIPGVWRNKHFLSLWLAQAISQTAQNAIWYGIVVLVQQRSNSSTQLSIAVLTLIVPSVIFGVLAGVYVDRWDKRLVLIGTNLLRGGVAFTYALFGFMSTLPLVALFLINFIFSTIGQFFAPAETSMIPGVVDKRNLLQANSLFQLTFTASQLIGLVILGPVVIKLAGGVNALFIIMAAAIMLCGGLVWPLPSRRGRHDPQVPSTELEAVAGVWHDIRDVGAFVLRERVIALAMVQWTIGAILGLVVATLMPGFASRLLRVHPEDAVFVLAPAGVGMVLGTLLLNRWGSRFDKHFLANTGLFVVAISLGLIGAIAWVLEAVTQGDPPMLTMPMFGVVSALTPVVMALALIAGFAFVAIMVPTQTYLQERAPVELRGRVFAAQLMLSNLATILPLLLLGGLADLIGVDKTLILMGLLIGIAGWISLRLAPGVLPWHSFPALSEPAAGPATGPAREPA